LGRVSERLASLDRRIGRALATASERRAEGLRNLETRLVNAGLARKKIERERAVAARHRLDVLAARMAHALRGRIAARQAELKSLEQLLASLGYKNVLARGFALVRDVDNKPLRLAAEIADGASLDIEFADGRKSAIAGSQVPSAKKSPARSVAKERKQGTLF
jgi:exodeoxyribonuclease VII large subunit